MITQSLDQALGYVQSQNVTGVMHLVCKEGERKFMEDMNVHQRKIQPPRDDFRLAALNVTLVVVGARRSVTFRPDLPLWSIDDVRNGRYDTLQPTNIAQNPGQLIAKLTKQAEVLLGDHGVRKIKSLVQQYPPNVDPQPLLTACKKLFSPLLDSRVVDSLFEQYSETAPEVAPLPRPRGANVDETPTFVRAKELFRDVLGERGEGKVSRLATKYPPDDMPEQFTRACQSVLAKSLGPVRAARLVERIWT